MKSKIEFLNHNFSIIDSKVFYDTTLIRNADQISFQILSDHYARDNNSVYYNDMKTGADPDSFELLSESYSKDKSHAYFEGKIIKDAHADSFEYISHHFAKDRNHIFTYDRIMEGVDKKSFEVLNGTFSRDKINIYSYERFLLKDSDESFMVLNDFFAKNSESVFHSNTKVEGADPESFEVIGGHFGRCGNKMFCGNYLLEGLDPASFRVLKEVYCKDKNGVYRYSYPINLEGIDTDSFEFFTPETYNYYAKDKNQVYLLGHDDKIVEGADPATFELLDYSYARDKNYLFKYGNIEVDWGKDGKKIPKIDLPVRYITVWRRFSKDEDNNLYYNYDKIKSADHQSFEIINNKYSMDKNNVYYHPGIVLNTRVIEGADPDSFELIDDKDYSKDRLHVYFNGSVIEKADPETFRLLTEKNSKGELKYSYYSEDAKNVFHRGKPVKKDPRKDRKRTETKDYILTIDYSQFDFQIEFLKEDESVYLEVLELILAYIRKVNRLKKKPFSINLKFEFKTPKPYMPGDLPKISANQFFYEISRYRKFHAKIKNFYNLVAGRDYWYEESDTDNHSVCLGMFASSALALYSEKNLSIMIDWFQKLDWEHHSAQIGIVETLYNKYEMTPLMMNFLGYSMMSYNSEWVLPDNIRKDIISNTDYLKLFFERVQKYEVMIENFSYEHMIRGLFPAERNDEDNKALDEYIEFYETYLSVKS